MIIKINTANMILSDHDLINNAGICIDKTQEVAGISSGYSNSSDCNMLK